MPEPTFHLLATKLYRPPPGDGLIVRSRLLDKLNEGLDRPLILVTAPAGYGKTTLVTSWLEASGCEHAWLSLDEGDSDLDTFLSYLIAAVRSAFPEMGSISDAALHGPILPQPARLADYFVQDLEGLQHPLIVVLDDYESVSGQEVRIFMERIIQHRPANLRLVLLSRSDRMLSLSRLRGRGQITEVRAADLRLTTAEARELLRQVVGADLPQDIAALLAERTEGWPAGLQMAAISLRDSSDREAFARRFAQSNDRLLMDYLVAEALDTLPEAERTLMLRTSILDRFCAPLCEAVSGEATMPGAGAAFIAFSWSANLFIFALDDEDVWYRYHHLFRDLLRHQLRQTASAEEIAVLHRRASAWFGNAGLIEEAITHAVAGNDPTRAAHLVETYAHQALNREDWRRLEQWIALLPEPALHRPGVLVAQAFLQHFRNRWAAVTALVEAAEKGLGAGGYTLTQQQSLRGAINALRATAYARGSPERMVARAELALGQLGPEMVFARSLAEFWQIYGLQQSGQTRAALELAQSALEQQHEQPDARTLRLLLALCAVYYDEADLSMMAATAATYRDIALRMHSGLSLAWANWLMGWAHYYLNEVSAAAESFGRVVGSPYQAHRKCVVDSFTGLALARAAQGDIGSATEVAADLREYLLDSSAVELMPIADSLALRIQNDSGPREALGRFVGQLEDQMMADFWEVPCLTTVRLVLRFGAPERLEAAAEILHTCRKLAESRHQRRRRIELALLEASVHAAEGDDAAALEALRQAVLLGKHGGGVRWFLDDGPALAPYLRRLLDQGVAPAYVEAILAAYAPESAGQPPVRALLPIAGQQTAGRTASAGLLTDRETDVLLLLEQRLTNKEIAARLVVSPRTVQKHTISIYEKLQVSNRREAVARARSLGLLSQML